MTQAEQGKIFVFLVHIVISLFTKNTYLKRDQLEYLKLNDGYCNNDKVENYIRYKNVGNQQNLYSFPHCDVISCLTFSGRKLSINDRANY